MTRTLPLVALAAAAISLAAQESALTSLVAAERAFARTSVEKGRVEAFLANFADDGIGFQPGPVKMKEVLKRPSSGSGPAPVLDWEPWTGDVAASGEMGYTTGPWIRRPVDASGAQTLHGWFFSVWRRAGEGPWRVVADIGITSPSAGDLRPHAFEPAADRPVRAAKAISTEGARQQLLEAEHALSRQATSASVAEAFRVWAVAGIRLYRDDLAPIVGKQRVEAHLARQGSRASWKVLSADVAEAGDLGYAYGSYDTEPLQPGAKEESGYYLRVWIRQPSGWQVACDVMNPLPPPR